MITNNKGDYLAQTIGAYDLTWERYEISTRSMLAVDQMTRFAEAIEHSFPEVRKPVLDAGSAFGRDTAWFATRGLSAFGSDRTWSFLRRGRELNPAIPFFQADIRRLPFLASSFAGVWCNATLLHLIDDDICLAMAEFYRVLVPGGQIFLSFKEGEGQESFVETFSSDKTRFFNYQTEQTVQEFVTRSGFRFTDLYTINERELFGPDKRDLNWVHCFATKPW